jgi:hypothetical protein
VASGPPVPAPRPGGDGGEPPLPAGEPVPHVSAEAAFGGDVDRQAAVCGPGGERVQVLVDPGRLVLRVGENGAVSPRAAVQPQGAEDDEGRGLDPGPRRT